MLRNKRGRDGERPVHRDEEWPPLAATGESPSTETKTQHSKQSTNQKKKKKKSVVPVMSIVLFISFSSLRIASTHFYKKRKFLIFFSDLILLN